LDKASVSKKLSSARSVPIHEGFYFYRDIGDPTGYVATSLGDFHEKLQAIDVPSIEFHFQREDFEKWIREVVGDDELYHGISGISRKTHGEELRADHEDREKSS
jgi:hypothetical protein